ncbi:hypothetical protein [Candidatus Phytoplasma pruni]|uniref:Uncharacterized protein n=1 Tax=Candidatus Phytoplasma pruni TaxID=479893 RepID=A0A851HA51_9MOLU|nr:hypothetical protein [Candidatus Phytoplasma pruni]NWN45767.1 hypothetical protein [Candidatus Phytoplasma pruni]
MKIKRKNILNFSILLLSLITVLLGIWKGYDKGQPYLSLYLFTRQTVLIVFISLLLNFINSMKTNSSSKITKILTIWHFICLINSFMMFVMYLKVANPEEYKKMTPFQYWVSFLEHKILPIVFIIYYFFLDKTALKLKQFYLGLFYPFHYFLIALIVGKHVKKYPYGFLNLINTNMLKFALYITGITLFIVIMSLLSIYLKNKILNKKVPSKGDL